MRPSKIRPQLRQLASVDFRATYIPYLSPNLQEYGSFSAETSSLVLACATVSDQDELEGGHVGRGVCGGGGGGGHLLVHAVLLVVQLWQRWPRVSEEGFRSE